MKDAAANLTPALPPITPAMWKILKKAQRILYISRTEKDTAPSYVCPAHAHTRISNELSTPSYTTVGLKGCPADVAARVNFGPLATSAARAAGPGGLAHGT